MHMSLPEVRSTGVELHEFLQRLGIGIGILEHPEQMLEQHNFARYIDSFVVGVGGPSSQLSEHRMINDIGADEVAPAGLADVDGMEIAGVDR